MEPRDRPHRATTSSSSGASELFICFTSRPSSTSSSAAATTMRIPSAKSLMSPARTAAPSLSSSLSRRLRSSGSVKAGEQSPMFPAAVAAAAARKKGCSFEAAEPSSPKVTCIGQVRVKSKKKKNKCKVTQGAAMARSRSQRRSGGEASFRRAGPGVGEGERECRPWGFCEALRSFGSEINCFVPCRGGRSSFCSSSKAGFEGEKEEKMRKGSSCGGAVFGWMMAVQESEEGKGGEVVGLVVQENGRREVSLVVEKVEEEKEVVEVEVVEESRASVCVPPKNALLLMRCRSDPVRMAALATRFWGSPAAAKVGAEEEEEEGQQQQNQQEQETQEEEEAVVHVETVAEKEEEEEEQRQQQQEQEKEEGEEEEEKVEVETATVEKQKNIEEKEEEGEEKDETKCEVLEENGEEEKSKDESFTESVDLAPLKEEKRRRSKGKEREIRRSRSNKEKERKRTSFSNEKEARRHSFSTERDVRRPSFSSSTMDAERRHSWSFSKKKSKEEEKEENPSKAMDSGKSCSKVEAGEKKRELPDCLLLMMYEPKLSMEVSKETWVCSTDFLQWRPKEVVPAAAGAAVEEQIPDPAPPLSEEVEKKLAGTPEPAQVAAAAAAQVAAYEPFVLTRCKSEPMRSSARLAPDACFWKSRHQPIGAAGIGF
ncbi:hypothetical protein DsansV1_C24g0181271 [Dioscorea sansibarensis]